MQKNNSLVGGGWGGICIKIFFFTHPGWYKLILDPVYMYFCICISVVLSVYTRLGVHI